MPITVRCLIHPEIAASFEDEAQAMLEGWRKLNGNHWASPTAMEHGGVCDGCHCYLDYEEDDYYDNIDNCGCIYCNNCFHDRGGYCCDRCERYHFSDEIGRNEVQVYDPNVGAGREEIWCDDCVDADAHWNSDEDCYEYEIPINRRNRGGILEDIMGLKTEPDGIRPEICPNCMTMGTRNGLQGQCPKCLENQAFNKRLRETTLWVYDTRFASSGWYHPQDHVKFKKTVYRNKNENPYLYYGVEIEVGIDQKRQTKSLSQIAKEAIEASKGLFVAESDSSVPNGIEFISRPLPYTKWSSDEIKQILKDWSAYLIKEGAYIVQPNTNGLHIHMSRIFFERNTKKKPNQINKDMDWVFQYFQPEIEAISQRKYTRFCESKIDQIKQRALQNFRYDISRLNTNLTINAELKKSELLDGREYHHSVVTQRENTIEIRCFKSEILPSNILAYIQFARNIAHSVRNKDIKGLTMKDLLASKESPELDEYIYKLEKHEGISFDKKVKDTMKQKITITTKMAEDYANGQEVVF